MAYYTSDSAKRIAKKLLRIMREEFNENARLNWSYKAVAEGLGFDHVHDMNTSLPGDATWDGDRCAEYLASNGYLLQDDAHQAVDWLEEELSRAIRGYVAEVDRETESEFSTTY